ncbi:OLD family endonuclease [Flammeovirga pectinis]|uniref:OLD family endonuclease n=1 Tax=Flammeovirga pectinis TaxID=2494373 RepID=A0A3Q9FNH4_9BACT|nr:AAA family ATPase [Flammeovirga pectinis]AZQ61720.1 OLD family endonuclease [Flammeovirga pectinis]
MSHIKLTGIQIENYRSFKASQAIPFIDPSYGKPISIIGYNNVGKTTLMNSILYGLQYKYVSPNSFTIDDFHNRDINNIPKIILGVESSVEYKYCGEKQANMTGYHKLDIITDGDQISGGKVECFFENSFEDRTKNYNAFGALRYFNIFYINFHNIKDEIVTQKSSWGNIKSFLGKHIQKLISEDSEMNEKKDTFHQSLKVTTETVLEGSKIKNFIEAINKNYVSNLRNQACHIEFGLPNYEDIFLQMLFKIGLNGDQENLVPINHFGDGYISMFIMAVIQAIAEFSEDDKCLFLFEEPESFLHENHQEYFYNNVLCKLAENGHQVIYTTHSDKMIDPFNTRSIVRLDMNENNETIVSYSKPSNEFEFSNQGTSEPDETTGEIITYKEYNQFIKSIEPNLNRILFSKKVILVEGPNDVLVYKEIIRKKVLEAVENNDTIIDKDLYARTFLNFENISIVCHHGKTTAIYLTELCKHFGIDYFVINDWDFEEDDISIEHVVELTDLRASQLYRSQQDSNRKGMLTNNWNLLQSARNSQIHFNVKKLESVIGHNSDNKNSLQIWNLIKSDDFVISHNLFPQRLSDFIGLQNLNINNSGEEVEDLQLT